MPRNTKDFKYGGDFSKVMDPNSNETDKIKAEIAAGNAKREARERGENK